MKDELRKGLGFGFLAYLCWGLFPLYFEALKPASAWEILSHRILWTLLLCLIVLTATKQLAFIRRLLRNPKQLAAITVAGLTIAVNWTVYVIAVTSGHVTEAALGYFLNPLVTVMLGVLVLRERLRPMQWTAVAVGLVACLYLCIDYGEPPWLSIMLALSFASYSLLKNRIGGHLSALESLSAETLALAPIAVVLLTVLTVRGDTTFTTDAPMHGVLLAFSGVATAIPLLFFAAAASRVPLTSIGLMQFMTPIMQLLCGVLLMGESMPASRWIGFAMVWVALVLLATDMLMSARRTRRERRRVASGATRESGDAESSLEVTEPI